MSTWRHVRHAIVMVIAAMLAIFMMLPLAPAVHAATPSTDHAATLIATDVGTSTSTLDVSNTFTFTDYALSGTTGYENVLVVFVGIVAIEADHTSWYTTTQLDASHVLSFAAVEQRSELPTISTGVTLEANERGTIAMNSFHPSGDSTWATRIDPQQARAVMPRSVVGIDFVTATGHWQDA